MEVAPEEPGEDGDDEKEDGDAEPAIADVFFAGDGRAGAGDALRVIQEVGLVGVEGGSAFRVLEEAGHPDGLVEVEALQVAAHDAAIEDAAWKLVEAIFFERAEVPHADLGVLRDVLEGDSAGRALIFQIFAESGHSSRRTCNLPAIKTRAPDFRRRECG